MQMLVGRFVAAEHEMPVPHGGQSLTHLEDRCAVLIGHDLFVDTSFLLGNSDNVANNRFTVILELLGGGAVRGGPRQQPAHHQRVAMSAR